MHTILKLYVAFFLATSVPARLWDGPLQTAPNLGVANQWGWNPAPTAAPSPLELAKRQNQLTSLCGYIAGNLSNPLTCRSGNCGFNPLYGAIGCCKSTVQSNGIDSLTGCAYKTGCLDNSAPCDLSCQSNTLLGRCASAAYPYCVKLLYSGESFDGFSVFDCTNTPSLTLDFFARASTEGLTSEPSPTADSSTIFPPSSTSSPSSESNSGSMSVTFSSLSLPAPPTRESGGPTVTQTAAPTSSSSGCTDKVSAGYGKLGGALASLFFFMAIVI